MVDTGELWQRSREKALELRERLTSVKLRYPILLSLMVLAAVFARKYFVGLLLVAATVTFSILVKRAELNKLGLELATFSTVISGYHFGPETGAIMGVLLFLGQVMTGRPGVYILWVLPTYAAAGYTAGIFTGTGIKLLGPAIAAVMQLVFIFFTLFLSRGRLGEYLQYASFNLIFNLVLFHAFGPFLVGLLNVGVF